MGGELEKIVLQKKVIGKKDSSELGKTINRNDKTKYQTISTDDNPLSNRKSGNKSSIKKTNNNNDLKRGTIKKKKEKLAIVSKNKNDMNQEKKVL